MQGVPFLLLTTSGAVFEGKVDSVVLPTAQGEIQVLPAHADYSSIVGVGWIRAEGAISNTEKGSAGKGLREWAVLNGLINITNGKVELLADKVYRKGSSEINDQLIAEYPGLAKSH